MQKMSKFWLMFFALKIGFFTNILSMELEFPERLEMQDTPIAKIAETVTRIQTKVNGMIHYNLRTTTRRDVLKKLALEIKKQIEITTNFLETHQEIMNAFITEYYEDLKSFKKDLDVLTVDGNASQFTVHYFSVNLQLFMEILENIEQQILKQNQDCSLYDLLISTITIGSLCFWMYQLNRYFPFSPLPIQM